MTVDASHLTWVGLLHHCHFHFRLLRLHLSKNTADTLKVVVKNVVERVGAALGVRVDSIKPIRLGGALVCSPSLAEREKVVI